MLSAGSEASSAKNSAVAVAFSDVICPQLGRWWRSCLVSATSWVSGRVMTSLMQVSIHPSSWYALISFWFGCRSAGVVPHVADQVQLLVTDIRDEADLPGGSNQVLVRDLVKVLLCVEVLSAIWRGHRNVEEVSEVVSGHSSPQLCNCLVPQVVESGIEEPGADSRQQLGEVHRLSALASSEQRDRIRVVLEHSNTLLHFDEDTLGRKAHRVES